MRGFIFFLILASWSPRSVAGTPSKNFDMRIIFGYKDTRPARYVGDRYEKMLLIANLIRPCKGKNLACGFQRDPEDAESLTKTITKKHIPFQFRIKIVSSSAGPDDSANRANPYQVRLSENAERNFYSGLESADVVFYVGHSREGGGPDFSPPQVQKDNQLDYAWYKENRLGLRKMQSALQQRSSSKNLYLGIISCSSQEHFSSELPQRKNWKMKTLSKPVYFMDALEKTSQELSHVIKQLMS